MRFSPFADRIVILPTKVKETTEGGIILPEAAGQRVPQGVVVEVGPDFPHVHPDKTHSPLTLVGHTIVHSKYGGVELEVGGETYLILSASDVLGVLIE